MDTMIESLREALAGAIRDLIGEIDRAGDSNEWTFMPDSPAVTDWTTHERPSGWGSQDNPAAPFPLPANPHLTTLRWVTTTGGEYFFAPAISALRTLGGRGS